MQSNEDPSPRKPELMSQDAMGAFVNDPLSPMLRELCYAIVFRDMQIAQLKTKMTYLEGMYVKLKQEIMFKTEDPSKNGTPNAEVTVDLK